MRGIILLALLLMLGCSSSPEEREGRKKVEGTIAFLEQLEREEKQREAVLCKKEGNVKCKKRRALEKKKQQEHERQKAAINNNKEADMNMPQPDLGLGY